MPANRESSAVVHHLFHQADSSTVQQPRGHRMLTKSVQRSVIAAMFLAACGPSARRDSGSPDVRQTNDRHSVCGTGILCGGQCIDSQSDTHHCGTCDRECMVGTECFNGECITPRTLGGTCAVDSDCPVSTRGPSACIQLTTGVKVCSVVCNLNYSDNCSSLGEFICVPSGAGSKGYCARRCEPTTGVNTCPPGLACDPRSVRVSRELDNAVCVYPACSTDLDCPVFLAASCGRGQACESGAACMSVPDDETSMRCALPGVCDKGSGLCAPNLGAGSGGPGATCTSDLDCLPQGRCDFERNTTAGIYARNGYCTVEGCAFSATLTDRACPPGSTCNGRRFPGGRCYKNCVQMTNCRGDSNDRYGDYECYIWTWPCCPGCPCAPPVTCEPAFPCAGFPSLISGESSILDDCAMLGTSATDIACRDRATGELLSGNATNGVCLARDCAYWGRTECNGKCCPAGTTCCFGTCCPTGSTCCYGTCADVETDINHCGDCGKFCFADQKCEAGKCVQY